MSWASSLALRARSAALALIAASHLIVLAGPAIRSVNANIVILKDEAATASLNTGTTPADRATVFDWFVRGKDHLTEISNFFRIANTGPEQSIHFFKTSETPSDADFDGDIDTVTLVYDYQNVFSATVIYNLIGGPANSGFSQLDEEIYITNVSGAPLPFHWFEYIDLDLNETPDNDTIQLLHANGMTQFDPRADYDGFIDADRYEMDVIGQGADTLPKLTDMLVAPSDLNSDLPPPALPPSAFIPLGPNNVSWALQFDFVGSSPPRPIIPDGVTVHIHKEGRLLVFVPEPASMTLFALAGAALLLGRRSARCQR